MRIVCSPTPSMSATAVQLISVSRPRDGQARFGQRCIASPSGFTIAVAQSGHCAGIRNSFVPRRCGPAGPTICGMTSPARCTITSSPWRICLRLMSSSLWSVARVTVTPPTCTGSMIAHGLSAPVRPTRMRISCNRVTAVVRAQPLEHPELRLELDAFAVAGSVDPDRERAVGGDRGVLLAEAPGSSVARIRRELLVRPREALVQLAEAGERQVDLAADLDHGRRVALE